MRIPVGDDLFQVGLLVMGAALFLLIAALVILAFAGKKLWRSLEQKYGKKRH